MYCAPAFRYQLKDYIKSLFPFYAVIVGIVTVSLIATNFYGGKVTFSGFGVAAAICLLVHGIVSPRPNLRLCIQFGVSRRSAFFSQLLAIFVSAVLLAAAGELLIAAGQALGAIGPEFLLTDLYQMLYVGQSAVQLSFGQHLLSLLFNLSLMLAMFSFGMFLTFMFWRLNKAWTIVAAISIPVLLNAVPALFFWLAQRVPAIGLLLQQLGELLSASVWSAVVLGLLIATLFVLISWLLVRRANIRAPQGD